MTRNWPKHFSPIFGPAILTKSARWQRLIRVYWGDRWRVWPHWWRLLIRELVFQYKDFYPRFLSRDNYIFPKKLLENGWFTQRKFYVQIFSSGFSCNWKNHSKGRPDIVNYLLEQKCDPNEAGFEGYTALMMAALGGHTETTLLLLEAGARRDTKNKLGKTLVPKIVLKFWVKLSARYFHGFREMFEIPLEKKSQVWR